VFFDGGYDPRRDLMGLGAVVCTPGGEVVATRSAVLEGGSSAEAEYRAAVMAVELAAEVAAERGAEAWELAGDAKYVIHHARGRRHHLTDPTYDELAQQIESALAGRAARWVRRRHNRLADAVVRAALAAA
jgi:ribonuclease HI